MKEAIVRVIPFHAAQLSFLPKRLFPSYHLVSDEDVLHVKHLYKYKRIDAFKRDIELLEKNYRLLSLDEYIRMDKENRKVKQPVCLLSFDDGMREVYDVIYPILRSRGIPAVFFLNSAFVNNKTMFYRHQASLLIERFYQLENSVSERKLAEIINEINRRSAKYGRKATRGQLKPFLLSISYRDKALLDELGTILEVDYQAYLHTNKPFMDELQIKELLNNGYDIGSHSVDHPLYSELSTEEQVDQTLTCMQELEAMFGIRSHAFAFPFNDRGVNKAFFDRINESMKKTFGTDGFKKDEIVYNIQRICLDEEPGRSRIIKQGLRYVLELIKGAHQIRR
ncbi:polysaccharide deacetylase family protein [Paenibacillus glycinis]|uniref:Polysaccharide deacetylase family protein n=1 Tax=Paenibacillus glycinis TaxID=2697035 RepID=A0ABW9XNW1_9BACL|nr:polysaccharide deacetylase family protein [Paenibacillus glycinis]NBD24213.1 polysaccharide deacetylase family protein [Paenibacillus glycinis]